MTPCDPHELLQRMKAGEASDREALDYIVESLGNAKTALENAGYELTRLRSIAAAATELMQWDWVLTHTEHTKSVEAFENLRKALGEK